MVNLTSLNSMISYMSNFQKTNSVSDVVSTDFNSRQFQQLAQKLQEQSIPNNIGSRIQTFNLKNSASELVASDKNASINSKVVESSSKAITGTAVNSSLLKSHSVKVNQIAVSQKNKTADLSSDVKTSLQEGSHTFKVSAQGKDTNVTFSIKEGDTNKESLDKIAKAINDSNGSINAKVITDDTNNTSRLEISSNDTGTKQEFSITDVSGSTAKDLGVTNINVKAQDSVYSVDGKEYTSQKNNVLLDDGKIKLTFNAVTDKDVNIKVRDDTDTIEDSIKKFADDYNKMLESINSSDETDSSIKFAKDLKKITNSQRGSLAGIGITVGQDGTMKVDEKRLEKALDENPNKVKSIVGGTDGIASRVTKVTDKSLKGVYDLSNAHTISNDYTSYQKNGAKALNIQNYSRGMFVDANL